MIVGMVDTSTLEGVLRLSQRPNRQPRPTPRFVEPTPSPVDFLASNYLRAAPQIAKSAAATNIFNPVPLATEAVNEGRLPTGAEAGLDAGFLAAGFLPVGKAASQLNAIVKRLNKSTDVRDFMTPLGLRNPPSNYANQGLYRGPDSVGGFTDDNLPAPAEDYLFGLVPTEKLSPLREFDRAAESAGKGQTGPDNLNKIAEHLAAGGKLNDPTAVAYYPGQKWGYLAEGNHRLALAEALGLEQLPATVWRAGGVPPAGKLLREEPFEDEMGRGTKYFYDFVGKNIGDLDVNQLALDRYSNFADVVGERYIPPDMHPYLLKYFQPGGN
jgi:hypothetical protein